MVADENIPQVAEQFASLGEVTVVNGRKLSRQQLRDADILLVRSVTQVDQSLLDGTSVRFVATATIGTDHLDIDYLDAHQIGWASAPGCNADSVVDYMISVFCRLQGVLELLMADGTVGIVGMGNVGSRLYQRLSRLGIACSAYDPLIDPQRYPVLTDLETVLQADIICLHAPLTTAEPYPSFHLLDEQRLAALKPGAVLINAGRGAVIDNSALQALLNEHDDICTVLDVWENEPTPDMALLKRVDLGSPHIAGYSYDGKLAGTAMIYQACCEFFSVEPVKAPVAEEDTALTLTIREQSDVIAAMREAVLACYDVAEDDQRFRGGLLHADQHERGAVFDQLRKNYPVRRELSRYRIANVNALDPPVQDGLAALGFICR
ncbi:hypothetical protein BST96_18400 [Oceanicoccus sagamiensis]|uniref:Erythronate-4-phosphate dehydrogenase n=1 Tax=Oceanicoccus sagamiensis TaxID=716816 RepID=A0A1X9NH53_9GAMM|nr:hypothetical protein BST96_18400 [Oceanicoccus sagamiensis]